MLELLSKVASSKDGSLHWIIIYFFEILPIKYRRYSHKLLGVLNNNYT